MKNKIKYIFLILSFISLSSCEDEREPLTLDDLYEINGLSTSRFSAKINGSDFETEKATALKTNTSLALNASDEKVSFVLALNDISEGVYVGSGDSSNIYLNYKDANGLLFSSNKNGNATDFEVEVTQFNPVNSTISGNFSGKMIGSSSDFEINVEKGSFIEVPVTQPFFGRLSALVEGNQFQAESCVFTSTNSGGFIFENFVASGNKDSTSLSITVEEKLQEKEYLFLFGGLTSTYISNTFSSNIFKNKYDGESGRLIINNIDSVNNRIEGTFNFIYRNAFGEPITISNGKINALVK